jgi:non-specific serine/threonine protein kinase/serine/threonine-protein kinase
VEEYVARHPALADRIRNVLFAVALIEQGRSDPTLSPEGPGSTIGRYKLLERIGEGGFGVVYMAEQQHPVRRKVALKVIKPGMDSKQVIARFEAERQALAMMDHRNIARVLDAGATDSGRPFVVMELVKGVPVTEYCDANNLSTRERLDLFVQVCNAVQHAHTKGVIHRDLKPTNVLVTVADGAAVPKVIDFGIAKATQARLTEKTLFTEFRQMVGTPAYMSPEQAEMNSADVDTRSDVYSLGVLLYELLTGTTPFDPKQLREAAYVEIQRIIREVEPPRPSTRLNTLGETLRSVAAHRRTDPARLGRTVRGELDWVVMKCLEKDRARRYATADGLARDVGRYLRDEPVEASPPGAGYRLRKFVKRNRGRVASAALVVAALLAGIAGTTWGMIRADHARRNAVSAKEEAQKRLGQVEKGTEILAAVFRDLDPIAAEKAGVTSRHLLSRRLTEAAQHLEGDAVGDPLVVARLQHLLGVSLRELRHPEQAEGVIVKALRTRERLQGPDHLDTVATKHELAKVYRALGKFSLAAELFEEVVQVRTARLGADHLDTAATKHHLAVTYRVMEKCAPAEELLREVLAVRSAALGADDLETVATKNELGVVYQCRGKHGPAEELLKEAMAARIARLGADHSDVSSTRYQLALLYHSQRKFAAAEKLLGEVVAARAAAVGANDPDTANAKHALAGVYCDQWKFDLAEPLYEEVLAARTAAWGPDHPDTLVSAWNLAILYRCLKQSERAIPVLRETLTRAEATRHLYTSRMRADLGALYCDVRQYDNAIPLLERAHREDRQDPALGWVGNALLISYVGARRTDDALGLAREQVREAREKFPADSPELAAEVAPPAEALVAFGAFAEAEPLLLLGYQGLKQSEARVPPHVDRRLQDAVQRLVDFYDAWGKPETAAVWRRVVAAGAAAPRDEPQAP